MQKSLLKSLQRLSRNSEATSSDLADSSTVDGIHLRDDFPCGFLTHKIRTRSFRSKMGFARSTRQKDSMVGMSKGSEEIAEGSLIIPLPSIELVSFG